MFLLYRHCVYRATLVWYDPPAVGGSTNKALMHDLDLIVTSPSGNRY